MRPILAILLSSLLIGGIYSYLSFSNSVRRPPLTIEVTQADGIYSLEIERTFRCVADPILEEPSLAVQFGTNQIYIRKDEVPIEESILIGPIEGVEEGENEFLITAFVWIRFLVVFHNRVHLVLINQWTEKKIDCFIYTIMCIMWLG